MGLSFLPLSSSGSTSMASWYFFQVASNCGCALLSFSACSNYNTVSATPSHQMSEITGLSRQVTRATFALHGYEVPAGTLSSPRTTRLPFPGRLQYSGQGEAGN